MEFTKFLRTLHVLVSLHEKCRNTEFFWSVFSCIRTEYEDLVRIYSVFTPNTGKYGPEKTAYLDTPHVVLTDILRNFF